MLRGFLLICLLITIASVAVLGFRGEKTTNEPWELFPDMVRQMKVRAQAPLGFFADGRGARVPDRGLVHVTALASSVLMQVGRAPRPSQPS